MTRTSSSPDTVAAEDSIPARFADVNRRIGAALDRSGRAGEPVIMIGVTKYATIDQIRQLLVLGHADFGENRVPVLDEHAGLVDEFLSRHRTMPSAAIGDVPRDVRWHMIGHLQRNKVRKVVGRVRLIHSVDSLRLAEEIQNASAARGADFVSEILIQVNVSGEKQKSGVAPAAALHLAEQVDSMFNVQVRGLMCMAPISDDPETSRPVFVRCRELYDEIRTAEVTGEHFDLLSMGMSGDYEVAIECGSNMVRVGSAIFGAPPQSGDAGESPDGGDGRGAAAAG